MSKSKILINRLAKLLEEGVLTSKDIGDEIKNSLNYRKESLISKLNLVSTIEGDSQHNLNIKQNLYKHSCNTKELN